MTIAVALIVALITGAVALRVPGIAFAMVTLAFAQAFYFAIETNPHNLTGGDSGLSLNDTRLPFFAQGAVSNTPNLYWVALTFLFVSTVVVWMVTSSKSDISSSPYGRTSDASKCSASAPTGTSSSPS